MLKDFPVVRRKTLHELSAVDFVINVIFFNIKE